jgi:hypothetical protein
MSGLSMICCHTFFGSKSCAMAADPNKLLLVAPFAPETRVQYFDSRDAHDTNEYLNDEKLEAKFPAMVL